MNHLKFKIKKGNNKARSQIYDHIYSNSTKPTVNASLLLIINLLFFLHFKISGFKLI